MVNTQMGGDSSIFFFLNNVHKPIRGINGNQLEYPQKHIVVL